MLEKRRPPEGREVGAVHAWPDPPLAWCALRAEPPLLRALAEGKLLGEG